MSDERTVAMSLPLDRDHFLRRECPTCKREFKRYTPPERRGEPVPAGGYYCPYCSVQAASRAWYTKPQLEQARALGAHDVVAPKLETFRRSLSDGGQPSGGHTNLDATVPLTDIDDMRRVEFACHPPEPVKVLEDWTGPVHCLICGGPAAPAAA